MKGRSNMKKGLSLILAFVMLLTFCACGKSDTPAVPDAPVSSASGCAQNNHTFGASTIIQEAYGGYDGILERSCVLCHHTETQSYFIFQSNGFHHTILLLLLLSHFSRV